VLYSKNVIYFCDQKYLKQLHAQYTFKNLLAERSIRNNEVLAKMFTRELKLVFVVFGGKYFTSLIFHNIHVLRFYKFSVILIDYFLFYVPLKNFSHMATSPWKMKGCEI
jgi:hypothetical protein